MAQEFVPGDEYARILTETTQSLVAVFDREGRILLFNEACVQATGFSRAEVIGQDARNFVIPPEEREAFGEFLTYVFEMDAQAPQVGHWMTKDGGRRLIAWSNRPMASAHGGPATVVTSGIDLTDRSPLRDDDERAFAGDPGAKLVEIGRLATEQRALRRVATLVASEAQAERVFSAVSEECARVLEVNASAVLRYEDDDTATVVGRHNRDSVGVLQIGQVLTTEDTTSLGQVRRT